MSELTVQQIQDLLASNRKAKVELEDRVKKLEADLKEAQRVQALKSLASNAVMSRNHEVQFGSLGLWTRELSQGDRVHVKSEWGGIKVVRLSDGKEFSLDTEYFRLDGQVDPDPDDVHAQTYLNGRTDCGIQANKGKVKTSQDWKQVTCPRCNDKQ